MNREHLPPPNKTNTQHFILGGLVIPEDIWHKISHDLATLKLKHNINGEIKWRYFSANNNDPTNSLAHLSKEERDILRNTLFNLITKYKSIKIISVVTNILLAYQQPYISLADDVYCYSYKILTERFQYYLQDISRTVGQKINGIIVCDHRAPRDDDRLRHLHQQLLMSTKMNNSSYGNLIEGVFIAPSHLSVGIQFADLVAGAIFRKFEHNDDSFIKPIKKSFRSSPNGQIMGYGLIQFPQVKKN